MLELIKKNWRVLLALLLFPIIFIGILKICIKYLPGEMIGSIDGWLGFLGGYFGVLGAIGAIWYQKNLDLKKDIEKIELYSNYIVKNLSNKLEKNLIPFLIVFSNFNGFNDLYEIQDIKKRKKDFNIINDEIINSNLSIILSDENFILLLNLKEKLENFNYYITKLEKDITRGDIYMPFINYLNKILETDKNSKGEIRNFIEELMFLKSTLFNLNMNYFAKKEKPLDKYKALINSIINFV